MCQHLWDPCLLEAPTGALEEPLSHQAPGSLQAERGHSSPCELIHPQTLCWARNMSRADPATALEPSSPVGEMESHQYTMQNVL